MALDGFLQVRLSQDHEIKPFDCGDDDLNDFLAKDAKAHQSKLLTVTYILEKDNETVAFFSIFNDKITFLEFYEKGDKKEWKKYLKKTFKLPQSKRYDSLPSMKIGRLGVSKNFQNSGLGTDILNFLKAWFLHQNKTGCKLITVDAYAKSIEFYKKNGFVFLSDKDKDLDTRQMCFDLSVLIPESEVKS